MFITEVSGWIDLFISPFAYELLYTAGTQSVPMYYCTDNVKG